STPSIFGICTSSRATSTSCCSQYSTACLPSSTAAKTSNSLKEARMILIPSLTKELSSATITLIGNLIHSPPACLDSFSIPLPESSDYIFAWGRHDGWAAQLTRSHRRENRLI